MNRQAAEDICRMGEEILRKLQALGNYVLENCEPQQIEHIVPALARCASELDVEILEPIHRRNSDLKPSFLP
ncbi:MAG: hypothetical protein PS018_21840 [bacterium]|nr:hypothetical protein [bacterium]